MSNKFDLHSYFYLKELSNGGVEDEEDPTQNPTSDVQNLQQAQPPVPPPTQQSPGQANQKPASTPQDQILKQKTGGESNAFSSMIGSTISDLRFKQNGPSGGEISIMTSKSNRPMKISWAGNKVTVTQSDGNVINLSERKI